MGLNSEPFTYKKSAVPLNYILGHNVSFQYDQNWMCQKWDLNYLCRDSVGKEALKCDGLWMVKPSDI